MVYTPPLEHDITTCLSKGTWLPSSAPQKLALNSSESPLFIKLTSDDEHESIFCSLRAIVLVTRSTYWKSFDFLLPQCHDRQPFSNAVGVRETTQGNDFDLQRTTQHVLFLSQTHWRRFVKLQLFCHDAILGTATMIQETIFDCCRVFEGNKTIPKS